MPRKITRKAALAAGLKRYYMGNPCKQVTRMECSEIRDSSMRESVPHSASLHAGYEF